MAVAIEWRVELSDSILVSSFKSENIFFCCFQFVGELQFSLCHEATSSHLKVIIMRLKDLPKSVKSKKVFKTIQCPYTISAILLFRVWLTFHTRQQAQAETGGTHWHKR